MLNYLMNYFKALPKTKKGQAMVEYGLIIALIAVILIVALTAMSGGLSAIFSKITGELNGAAGTTVVPDPS